MSTIASIAPTPTPASAEGLVTVTAGSETERSFDAVSVLLRVPGTESVQYRLPDKTYYQLNQVNPVFGKLADAVLEDVIDGAKITFASEGELPEPPDAGTGAGPWWERRIHMIKTIAALPGVHDYQFIGSRGIAFHTVNKEAQKALNAMIVDNLPDPHQTKVFFVVSKTGPEPNGGTAGAESAADGAAAVAGQAEASR